MRGIKLFREENTRVRYLTEEKEFRLLQTLPGALPSPRNLHLHDLRHTWASRLTMAGVDPWTIKRLGDWKTLAMVQQYAHLSLDHKR